MAKKKTMKWLVTGGLVLGVALMGGTLWATSLFKFGSSCTTINCDTQVIQGFVSQRINAVPPNSAMPWVAEIYSEAGRCTRFAVISQQTDLMTVVRTSNGTVYRNDDGGEGACTLCPVVKIDPTPANGLNTVTISRYDGSPVEAEFTLLYGYYPGGNPNCGTPTTPLNSLEPSK